MKILRMFFVVMLLLLASCAKSEPPETPIVPEETNEKQVNIAVLIPVLGNTYNEAIVNGIKDTCAEMGATYSVYVSDYDTAKQVQQVQDAITAGFDAIIINPNDGVVVLSDLQEAAEAGLAIGAVDSILGSDLTTLDPPEGVNVVVTVLLEKQGIDFATKVVEVCADRNPCRVVYLSGFQYLTGDQERLRGFHSVVDEHPNIEVVAEQEGKYLQDEGFNVVQNILQSNPDIDVIFTVGDQMSIGAAQAVADAGLDNEITILGNGASAEGLQAIKEGRLFASYALLPYTEGQLVAEWIIRAARGETVKLGVDMSQVSPPLPASGPWIDETTVENFQGQW